VSDDKRFVLLGRFGAAHGLKGEVRVQSFTGDPRAIGDYGALFDKEGARQFRFAQQLRPLGKDMLVARLDGVTTREAAERLNGVEIFALRKNLPAEGEDEFYLADLIGLRAETLEGALLGVVVSVQNFGAGDILEVAPPDRGETRLFPFTKSVVPLVDAAKGRVVIAPPREVEGEE